MDIKKRIAIILIVCLTLGFAGCSSKKKSTSPIVFVVHRYSEDSHSTFSMFVNSDGEYFTVGPYGTYTTSEFNKFSDVPSFQKSGVSTGMIIVPLSEYEVEGVLFSQDELAELNGLLSQVSVDTTWNTVRMPEYAYEDFPYTQGIEVYAYVEGAEDNSLCLLSLSNREGGEVPKDPNTFIGYCADDESSMKIVAKLLNKAPLKDKEREYFISYPDCLDAA
jgi:hypothetical protein